MLQVQTGQCGLCTHFAEGHSSDAIVQIRRKHEAAESFIDTCGHPRLSGLHLRVTAVSGCDGFEMAKVT